MAIASLIGWLSSSGVKDNSGNLLAGGQVYFYAPGTTTQTLVYADKDSASPLSQPVTLDSYGRADVYVVGRVKMGIHSSAGSLVKTYEDATGEHAEEVILNSAAFTGPTGAASEDVGLGTVLGRALTSLGGVDFNYRAVTGATARAVKSVIEEMRISVKDYGATGNATTDDTSAFLAAIARLKAIGGGTLLIPYGTYLLSDQLLIDFNNFTAQGTGWGSILRANDAGDNVFNFNAATSWALKDFQINTDTITGTVPAVDINAVSDDGLIDHILFQCEQECIDVNASDRVRVRDCKVVAVDAAAAGVAAVAVTSSTDFRLSGSEISNVNGKGLDLSGASTLRIWSRDNFYDAATGFDLDSTLAAGATIFIQGDELGNVGTLFSWNTTAGINVHYDPVTPTSLTVASASAINHQAHSTLVITGTTTMELMRASYIGHVVTLLFSTVLTVEHQGAVAASGNHPYALEAGVNYITAAGSLLQVVWDGTNWREVGRRNA